MIYWLFKILEVWKYLMHYNWSTTPSSPSLILFASASSTFSFFDKTEVSACMINKIQMCNWYLINDFGFIFMMYNEYAAPGA